MTACLSFFLLGSSAPLTLHSDIAEPRISMASERRPSSSLSRPAVVNRQPTPSDSPVLEYKRFSGFDQLCASLNLDTGRSRAQNGKDRFGKRRPGSAPLPVVHENWVGGEEHQGRGKRCDSEPIQPPAFLLGISHVEDSSDVEPKVSVPPKQRPHSLPTARNPGTPLNTRRLSMPTIPMPASLPSVSPTPRRASTAPPGPPFQPPAEGQALPHSAASKHSHTRSRSISHPPLSRPRPVAPQLPAAPGPLSRASTAGHLSKRVSFSEADEVICASDEAIAGSERRF